LISARCCRNCKFFATGPDEMRAQEPPGHQRPSTRGTGDLGGTTSNPVAAPRFRTSGGAVTGNYAPLRPDRKPSMNGFTRVSATSAPHGNNADPEEQIVALGHAPRPAVPNTSARFTTSRMRRPPPRRNMKPPSRPVHGRNQHKHPETRCWIWRHGRRTAWVAHPIPAQPGTTRRWLAELRRPDPHPF
jgi:hypothetical protein